MRSNFSTNSCLFQQNKLSLPSLMEAFSSNIELLSTIEKMPWKLHGKLLAHVSKTVDIKIKIMKGINQKALKDSFNVSIKFVTFYQKGILLGVI